MSADGLGDAAQPGTGEVTATVIVNAPAERVFAAFLNWEKQSQWIPFTELRVVRVNAPYEVRVVHCGKVLRGPGSMRCTAMSGDRTQVVLHEWFHLPGGTIGKIAWPVLWPGSKLGFTGALKKFGRLVEQGRLS
jgi:uncharacterized membrane protein